MMLSLKSTKTLYQGCFLLLTVLFISLGSQTAYANQNFQQRLMQAANTQQGGAYVRQRFLQQMKKPFNAGDRRKKVLLIGDSHAQDFYNVLHENGRLRNMQISTRYIPTRCQMYLGPENVERFVQARDRQLCRGSDHLKNMLSAIKQADVVILVANWKKWSAQRLPGTIKQLGLQPQQKLIVLGRKSYGRINVRSYLRMSPAQLKNLRNNVDNHQVGINNLMRNSLPRNVFVDQQQQVCQNASTCPVFTPNLDLISFDGGHFTPAGARYAGQRLLSHPLLRGL